MSKQENMLDLDVFGEMMDELIKRSNVQLLIEMPEGSSDATTRCNVPGGPVMEFYIILNAIEGIYKEMLRILDIDDEGSELLDSILELLRSSIKGEE